MTKLKALRIVGSYVWALSPVYTLGLGTPVTMLIAAVRFRSRLVWLTLIAYIVLAVIAVAALATGSSAGFSVFGFALLTSASSGMYESLALRRGLFGLWAPPETTDPEELRRRELRARAADLVKSDPARAAALRIGRPDLERSYDDGGLVDVNHAPASALTGIPGMTPERAARIVRVRDEMGGFQSIEEVAIFARMPPGLTRRIAEYGVFPR